MRDGLDVIGGGGPYVNDEDRWLATLRARRAAGAYAVATIEDVERLIAERDEARTALARTSDVIASLRTECARLDATLVRTRVGRREAEASLVSASKESL